MTSAQEMTEQAWIPQLAREGTYWEDSRDQQNKEQHGENGCAICCFI